MNRFIRTIGIFSIVVAWSGSAVAETIKECEVSGAAVIPGGVMFDGTFSDTGGIESIDWTHDTPDFSFVTTEVSDTLISDGIICRQNGRETGVVLSEGTGTYNGMPGYGYLIETEDNRGPPDFVTLVSSISYYPTDRNDDVAIFGAPKSVTIPTEISVTVGGSGNGKVRLILDDDTTCTYLGTGTAYAFDRCNDPLGSGYVAGDSIDVSKILLRIQQADRSFALTSVEVELGAGVAPGTPDFYRLIIFDPSGTEIYRLSTSIVTGDIAITLIDGGTPKP